MRYILLFCLPLLFGCSPSNAQSTVKNGSISYSISVDSDEPAAAFLASGSSLKLYFSGAKIKVAAEVMGGANSGRAIIDEKKSTGLVILDVLGEKKAIILEKKYFDDADKETAKFAKNPIRKLEATKTIAGYLCSKVLMKDLESGTNLIFYVTNKIQPQNDYFNKKLGGFPLGVYIRKNGTTVKITAKKIYNQTPKSSTFDLVIPGGYQSISVAELHRTLRNKG